MAASLAMNVTAIPRAFAKRGIDDVAVLIDAMLEAFVVTAFDGEREAGEEGYRYPGRSTLLHETRKTEPQRIDRQ
jgi:hypothetical protein